MDHPRASIIAINFWLIAWGNSFAILLLGKMMFIQHSLKTKSGYAYIRAGFRYLFHQETDLIYVAFNGVEGMLNIGPTPGQEIRIILNPSLHLIQQVFVYPGGYSPAIFAASISILDIAALA
jgi:hypothetical protein